MDKILSSDQPAGGSKSPEKENTGNGEKAAELIEKAPTVANSQPSKKAVKEPITKEHALEILQSAIVMAIDAGIHIKVVPVKNQVILVLNNVHSENKMLVLEAPHVS